MTAGALSGFCETIAGLFSDVAATAGVASGKVAGSKVAAGNGGATFNSGVSVSGSACGWVIAGEATGIALAEGKTKGETTGVLAGISNEGDDCAAVVFDGADCT